MIALAIYTLQAVFDSQNSALQFSCGEVAAARPRVMLLQLESSSKKGSVRVPSKRSSTPVSILKGDWHLSEAQRSLIVVVLCSSTFSYTQEEEMLIVYIIYLFMPFPLHFRDLTYSVAWLGRNCTSVYTREEVPLVLKPSQMPGGAWDSLECPVRSPVTETLSQ